MKLICPHATSRRPAGFTLIEILVVIGIIGLLAAMISGLAGPAADSKKRKLVEAEKNKLMMVIDAYHEKMGFYPPDNVTNVTARNPDEYFWSTAQSPLYYELTGTVFTSSPEPLFIGDLGTNSVADAKNYFGRGGFANSTEMRKFLLPPPTDQQRKSYGDSTIQDNKVYGLSLPVDLKGTAVNYWHYDSSSTNRHNPDSYDLWAVFTSSKGTVTNGNWSQQ